VQRLENGEVRVTTQAQQKKWLPLEIILPTGAGEPSLDVSWFTAEDMRPRALPLRRVLLPWATPSAVDASTISERRIPEIAGGDWRRGQQIFSSEQAACSKCHALGGTGGKIGPDLSNLIYRDYASVLRDITQPSAAINPEHITYNVELKNGESVAGVVLDDTPENVTVGQATGANLVIPKTKVSSMKASSLSLMPEGLWQGLNEQQQRDLMTFLLSAPK
jgi:putative heme-binding domain-containing protein